MCFSATVSFVASGVLVVTGGVCIKEALSHAKHAIYFAITPFIFGLQQFIEGLVWVGVRGNYHLLTKVSSIMFLFFALCFWIAWIPLVAYTLECNAKVKRFLGWLVIVGLLLIIGFLTAYFGVPILMNHTPEPFSSTVNCGRHICYPIALKNVGLTRTLHFIYVLFGCLLLLCTNKSFRCFWFAVMISGIITKIIQVEAWTSTWCFFAAITSIYILYLIKTSSGARPDCTSIREKNLI